MEKYILIYLIAINIFTFILMALDKHRAAVKGRRTPEALFIFLAVIGGSIGVFLGMHLFKHKTKHTKFYIGVPIILFLQFILAALIILK